MTLYNKRNFRMSGRSAHAVGVVDVWMRRTMRTVQREASSSDERRRETRTLYCSYNLLDISGLHTADAPPQADPGEGEGHGGTIGGVPSHDR